MFSEPIDKYKKLHWNLFTLAKIYYRLLKQIVKQCTRDINHNHAAGSSLNSVFYEEIRKIWLGFTIIFYEKIFGSINK